MDIILRTGSLLNGIMVYWDKIEDSARYYVKLYIKDYYSNIEQELETVEIDRNKFYHTFQGLAKLHYERIMYFVEVLAENRNGQIIARSKKVEADVL